MSSHPLPPSSCLPSSKLPQLQPPAAFFGCPYREEGAGVQAFLVSTTPLQAHYPYLLPFSSIPVSILRAVTFVTCTSSPFSSFTPTQHTHTCICTYTCTFTQLFCSFFSARFLLFESFHLFSDWSTWTCQVPSAIRAADTGCVCVCVCVYGLPSTVISFVIGLVFSSCPHSQPPLYVRLTCIAHPSLLISQQQLHNIRALGPALFFPFPFDPGWTRALLCLGSASHRLH